MKVYKLWDSAQFDKFTLPLVFSPAPHKFTGTPIENLCELAGRVCYDSIDGEKGKDSKHYHEHIREVKHDSIYGHVVLPFVFKYGNHLTALSILAALSNRPGVFVSCVYDNEIWANISLRAAIQWGGAVSSGDGKWKHGASLCFRDQLITSHNIDVTFDVRNIVVDQFNEVAPNVVGHMVWDECADSGVTGEMVRGCSQHDHWMSVYIEGVSRDLLQELVRHHYQSAPSVRSTRYCDESCSNFIAHPALDDETRVLAEEAAGQSRAAYSKIFAALKAKNTPLKVARGAARCVLPGGTETKLVYSASVKQWQWLASMRVHSAADLEIQNLAKECVKQLELN